MQETFETISWIELCPAVYINDTLVIVIDPIDIPGKPSDV